MAFGSSIMYSCDHLLCSPPVNLSFDHSPHDEQEEDSVCTAGGGYVDLAFCVWKSGLFTACFPSFLWLVDGDGDSWLGFGRSLFVLRFTYSLQV